MSVLHGGTDTVEGNESLTFDKKREMGGEIGEEIKVHYKKSKQKKKKTALYVDRSTVPKSIQDTPKGKFENIRTVTPSRRNKMKKKKYNEDAPRLCVGHLQ